MLCLRHTGAEILPQGPIITREEFAVVLDARDIIARAEAEAEQIRTAARDAAAQERERGYRDGIEQAKAEMAERVVETMSQSATYFSRLEEALVDLVVKATRRVIGELDAPERASRIVRQALELLRQENHVRIKVPPALRDALQARVNALLSEFPRIRFLDIEADPRLPEDGCVLETELGVIDASVETQLRAIEKALIKAIK